MKIEPKTDQGGCVTIFRMDLIIAFAVQSNYLKFTENPQ